MAYKRNRPKFWDKARRVVGKAMKRLLPLDKVSYTLDIYFEPGIYENIQLEKLNAEIYKAIAMMKEIGPDDRVDTKLTDHRTTCNSGRASYYVIGEEDEQD